MPSWIFIIMLTIAGIASFLTIAKKFKVPFSVIAVIAVSSAIALTYWVGSSLHHGCEILEGYMLLIIGAVLILFPAIKNKQEENKAG